MASKQIVGNEKEVEVEDERKHCYDFLLCTIGLVRVAGGCIVLK